MTTELDFTLLEKLGSLKHGGHKGPSDGACVMEAVAFVAGEKWSDHPECVSPVIGAFLRSWNDSLPTDADRDRLLKPLIPKIIDTRSTSAVMRAFSSAERGRRVEPVMVARFIMIFMIVHFWRIRKDGGISGPT